MAKKRKKRKSRYKPVKLSDKVSMPKETPEELLKEFPDDLVKAFVAVVSSDWKDGPYKKYRILAKKFLGSKFEDKIDQGMLIVRLSRATKDMCSEVNKSICSDHPKYKAMRSPRSECKRCWSIYNGKKTKKKKTKTKA